MGLRYFLRFRNRFQTLMEHYGNRVDQVKTVSWSTLPRRIRQTPSDGPFIVTFPSIL